MSAIINQGIEPYKVQIKIYSATHGDRLGLSVGKTVGVAVVTELNERDESCKEKTKV